MKNIDPGKDSGKQLKKCGKKDAFERPKPCKTMGVLLKINVARVRKKAPKMMTNEFPKPSKMEARIVTILFWGSKRGVKGSSKKRTQKKVSE